MNNEKKVKKETIKLVKRYFHDVDAKIKKYNFRNEMNYSVLSSKDEVRGYAFFYGKINTNPESMMNSYINLKPNKLEMKFTNYSINIAGCSWNNKQS